MPPAKAAKALAGLLTYSPGPGLYSRMERAVQQMPKVIRTQELPGLLRKYKDGVPGWEVKAVAPAIGDSPSISREALLGLIHERSPAFTHHEIMLGGRPQSKVLRDGEIVSDYLESSQPLGLGGAVFGPPKYDRYSQGGDDYAELLLLQPNANGRRFESHWPNHENAVAHARFDTHGDALRINELQSDLGIYNRKVRAGGLEDEPDSAKELAFPLEDDWAEILIKRLALEAARQGHRAIEVASPRAIADTVGGSIDNYEHFYGKVVPGAIERLGRKMGGLAEVRGSIDPDPPPRPRHLVYSELARRMGDRAFDATHDAITLADGWAGRQAGQMSAGEPFGAIVDSMISDHTGSPPHEIAARFRGQAQEVHDRLVRTAIENGYPEEAARALIARAMPGVMRDAENAAELWNARSRLDDLAFRFENAPRPRGTADPGRRYIMSDAMRKRILRDGIGMSVMGAAVTDPDAVLERLQEQE